MEARINYNFHALEQAMQKLRNGKIAEALREIPRELNRFFRDSCCSKVIYTKNTDKLFFGMTTYCVLDQSDIDKIVNSDEPVRINHYYIEIDSKLLEIGFNTKELTAFILHEVGHVVNDSSPVEEVRKAIDAYMVQYKSNIDLDKSRDLNYLFMFAIKDAIRKTTSIFTRNDQEILADEFVFRCGYGPYLESGFKKLKASALMINTGVENKFVTLQWVFRIYTDIGMHRLGALKVLNSAVKLTGSQAEKQEINDTIKHLKAANLESYSEAAYIEETDKGLVAKLRRGGLKGIEEDVYEYQMRIRNVEDENDAIVLMRQINTRMSVLDDYLYNSENINEGERKRWEKVLSKYEALREELSKKTVYNGKQYGLWLDYNYAQFVTPQGDLLR